MRQRRPLNMCRPQRSRSWHRVSLLAMVLVGIVRAAIAAEPGPAEFEIIGRTLGFLTPPARGTIQIGLVYPTGSAAGRSEAEQIAATLGSQFGVDDLTLRPLPMTVEEAGRSSVPVLLITRLALPAAQALAGALAGKRVITVSTELSSVDANQVVVVVSAHPSIEIFVSRAATKLAGLQFSSAFRMLIQER